MNLERFFSGFGNATRDSAGGMQSGSVGWAVGDEIDPRAADVVLLKDGKWRSSFWCGPFWASSRAFSNEP